MFCFMSIKRLVFSTGKALLKNTTRMGGDFSANLKDLPLKVRKEYGGTFALEIRPKAYRLFDKK
jgi:hypothetical protein